MKRQYLVGLILAGFMFSGCGRSKEAFRLAPAEGASLPAVTALAWLSGGEYPEGEHFASLSADGFVRVWDVFFGLVSVYDSGAGPSGIDDFETSFPVLSPDGTRKLFPSDDGSIHLETDAGKGLARYYSFGSAEWVSAASSGFYNGSFTGASFIEVKAGRRRFRLDQLAGALYRPDLFKAHLRENLISWHRKGEAGGALKSLFAADNAPPELSLFFDEGKGELKIIVTEQKGGAGLLALYRRFGGEEIPAGLFGIQAAAEKTYTKRKKTCYEINLNPKSFPEIEELGISVFNGSNTIESGRLWAKLPRPSGIPAAADAAASAARPPVLRLLLAGGDTERASAETLEEFFSLQAQGELYSAVELKRCIGEEFSRDALITALRDIQAEENKNDVLVLYLGGRGLADTNGNLHIAAGKPGTERLYGEELLQSVLGLSSNTLLLLDLSADDQGELMETALLRFRQRLGPKAMLAGNSIASPFVDALGSGFGTRYAGAADSLRQVGQRIAKQGILAFPPIEDFNLADLLINAGELKFQTMASGMLKIDRVDASPIPLAFGNTMVRTLAPGSYIIDMVYRNGYRETRTVQLRNKDSTWVIFTYTPPLLVGNFSANLPSLGINTAELNPANYQKINKEAMEGMGMAPYYVAFLAGGNFYKDGNFDKAIDEYDRAISLKTDYADAYAARGNAQRRKGELNKAIDDYNTALSYKRIYPEVYNYRGFAYAGKGELVRAIDDYTWAIRYKADYADAYFNRAHAYGQRGNWDQAIADFTQVIKLEPSNASAYRERGKAWTNKGDTDKADADYAAAEKLRL